MELSIKMTDKQVKSIKSVKTPKVEVGEVKKKKVFKILLAVFLILFTSTAFYFLYKGYKATKDFGFQFTPGQIIEKKKEPELKKDSTGKYTNVLMVGIDTRENTQLLNTDVIIVGSYNHETKDIVMISVPRDFHAQTNLDKIWFNKINSTYMVNEQKLKGSGLPVLEEVVEGITGLEIQYHAMINFNGFVELIDAVGGVYINVENSFTDYMYPLGYRYQTVTFKAGPQLMDGETALKYTRSRHSQQNGEGSDYARARRQQKVIDALKDAVLSSETLLNPTKLMAMFSTIQNNVKVSVFTLEDIQAGVEILEDMKEKTTSSTYSFVLDPTIGNYSLIGTDVVKNAGYAIAPKEGLGQYTKIKEFIQLSLNNPSLYSENPSIYIYNTGLGYQETYTKTNELREHFKYLNIRFMGSKYSDKEGVYIYSNKEGEYSSSVNALASYLKIENLTKPEYITTRLNNEDISLLFGKAVVEPPTEESTQ